MQKELDSQFPKRKKFLSLHSISNHVLTFRGYHNASLLLSPQVSLTIAPFLGAPRRWSVSFSTGWSRTKLGTGPGALTYPVAIPGELVHPSNESSQGSAVWRVRTLVQKRTWNSVRGKPPHSFWGSFAPAGPSHQSGNSRGWRVWSLAGTSRNVAETSNWETKHHILRIGELRFITPAGPEELTLQALSPKQRGYRARLKLQTIVGNTSG